MSERVSAEVEAHSDRVIARRLTMAYVCGLLLIGVLTAGVHGLLDHIISQQRDAATIVNVAGRQRMLSQRIALLANDLGHGDTSARAPLGIAIAQMERALHALVRGDDLGISRTLSPAMHAYFFDGPRALEPAVRAYLGEARTFLATASPEALARLKDAARNTLLQTLDRAVTLFDQEASTQIDSLRFVQTSLLAILLVALLIEATFVFRPLVNRVGQTASRLLDLATHDGLTDLINHRFFMEAAGEIITSARTPGRELPVSMLMLDLDHFKRVNDSFGHAIGDQVLARVGRTLREALRASDLCAGMGGEEFAVLLYRTDIDSAIVVAEKLRTAIAADQTGPGPAITVSIGLTSLAAPQDTLDRMLERADQALYRAKAGGRNCVRVVCAHEPAALPDRIRATDPASIAPPGHELS